MNARMHEADLVASICYCLSSITDSGVDAALLDSVGANAGGSTSTSAGSAASASGSAGTASSSVSAGATATTAATATASTSAANPSVGSGGPLYAAMLSVLVTHGTDAEIVSSALFVLGALLESEAVAVRSVQMRVFAAAGEDVVGRDEEEEEVDEAVDAAEADDGARPNRKRGFGQDGPKSSASALGHSGSRSSNSRGHGGSSSMPSSARGHTAVTLLLRMLEHHHADDQVVEQACVALTRIAEPRGGDATDPHGAGGVVDARIVAALTPMRRRLQVWVQVGVLGGGGVGVGVRVGVRVGVGVDDVHGRMCVA
jgi:hypothetical protein